MRSTHTPRITVSRKAISIFTSVVMVLTMAFPVSSYAAEGEATPEQGALPAATTDTGAAIGTAASSEPTDLQAEAKTSAPADDPAPAAAAQSEEGADSPTPTAGEATDAQAATTAAATESASAAQVAAAGSADASYAPMATATVGDFTVDGDEGSYTYADGVLTITGDATVSTSGETTQRIVIDRKNGSAPKVTLAGVTIKSAARAAITVKAGVKAIIELMEGTTNTVTGGSNSAGVEVGYDYDANAANPDEKTIRAKLTVEGDGTLEANGGSNSAGIGGSYTNTSAVSGKNIAGYCGDIIVNGGAIIAKGGSGGAGIGSAANSNRNSDGSSNSSSSVKMAYEEGQLGSITINDGSVTATGGSNAAGIGGGNHADSGKITINGGTVDAKGDSGIGSGLGSSKDDGNQKGPGNFFADVTINDGDVTAYATNSMGAGIGGGMYGDAYVTINGGTVNASVTTSGNAYQGGAGIGGGYQGAAIVTINGGDVTATGGNGSPGIGNGALAAETTSSNYSEQDGWTGTKNVRTGSPEINGPDSKVEITGGTVTAQGGYAGAGIGSGNSSEWCNVIISGGVVTAIGYASDEATKEGAAGIGSGSGYVDSKKGYMKETTEAISITGGTVLAIGGWGAAGIGSGARNEMADSIAIDAENASIQAYADGTKLAIDRPVNDQPSGNVSVTGNLLQGTFVYEYEDSQDNVQGTEGLKQIILTNESTGATKTLVLMPDGYRSYGTDVLDPGTYVIRTNSDTIGASGHDESGEGAYFSVYPVVEWDGDAAGDKTVEYAVVANSLSNYLFLFPVKTIVVDKQLDATDLGDRDKDSFLAGLTQTFYFAIADYKGDILLGKDGKPWIQTIDVVDGVVKGSAYFANMNDGDYEIWEVDADGNKLEEGTRFGEMILKMITTRHGDSSDNNASLAEGVWLDAVSVINTFAPIEDDPEPFIPPIPIEPDNAPIDDEPNSAPPDDEWAEAGAGASATPVRQGGGSSLAKTGDDVPAMPIALLLMAGAACVVAGIRRRA